MDQKSPKHYKVHSAGNRLHLSGCSDQSFANLQALVDYYKSASKVFQTSKSTRLLNSTRFTFLGANKFSW